MVNEFDDLDKFLENMDVSTMPDRYVTGGVIKSITTNEEIPISKHILRILLSEDLTKITDDDKDELDSIFGQFYNAELRVNIIFDDQLFKNEVKATADALIKEYLR